MMMIQKQQPPLLPPLLLHIWSTSYKNSGRFRPQFILCRQGICVTAAEKKLVTNYRKCNALEKKIINVIVEKAAGGLTRLEGLNIE